MERGWLLDFGGGNCHCYHTIQPPRVTFFIPLVFLSPSKPTEFKRGRPLCHLHHKSHKPSLQKSLIKPRSLHSLQPCPPQQEPNARQQPIRRDRRVGTPCHGLRNIVLVPSMMSLVTKTLSFGFVQLQRMGICQI